MQVYLVSSEAVDAASVHKVHVKCLVHTVALALISICSFVYFSREMLSCCCIKQLYPLSCSTVCLFLYWRRWLVVCETSSRR